MRKILLALIIVILVVFGITSMVKGVQIGGFKIYSIEEIKQNSQELDTKIQEVNTLIDVQYPNKRENLTTANKEMQNIREKYLNETTFTSEEELESALQIRNYDIERLWAVIGNHAIDQGVNLTLEVKAGSSSETRNLEFTMIGTYLGQLNFLYAIEDDEELGFRIYNYKLLPYLEEGIVLKSTFTIKDVRITKGITDSKGVPDPEGSMNEKLNSTAQSASPTPSTTPTATPTGDAQQTPTPTPSVTPTPTATPTPENQPTPTPEG